MSPSATLSGEDRANQKKGDVLNSQRIQMGKKDDSCRQSPCKESGIAEEVKSYLKKKVTTPFIILHLSENCLHLLSKYKAITETLKALALYG